MVKKILSVLTVLLISCYVFAGLPVRFEELTAPDFIKAVEKSKGICIIPLGIMEKHGAHLPLGTDMYIAQKIAELAAGLEYAVIFPPYYFGQIYEAKQQPGTIAYSPELVWNILQETCDELARNGFRKIIFVNGHGGNNHFLGFFCQAQLAAKRDYAVFLFQPENEESVMEEVNKLRKTTTGGHGCELETSMLLAHRPDLVHLDRAPRQSGEDLKRLSGLPYAYTGIWWYARYPNHYAGDGSQADVRIGELLLDSRSRQLAALIKYLKEDNTTMELMQRFFRESKEPLKTEQ